MLNSKIKTYLDRLADSMSRPSSYIFAGADEAGKEEAIYYFIAKVSGKLGDTGFAEKMKSKNHPDVVIIDPEVEEKKGKTREKEISIFQVREALGRLKYFPYELEKKFCIIKKAQKMNAEASNALLKSLEEPSEKAIFALLANNVESVLPTIVSRCATLRFPETKLPEWNEENRGKLREILSSEIFEKFNYIENISKNKNEFIAILKDWELIMAESLRKLIREGRFTAANASSADGNQARMRKVIELLEKTREATNRLEYTNANARGVGEQLVLDA